MLVELELLDVGALPVGETLGKILRRVVRAEVQAPLGEPSGRVVVDEEQFDIVVPEAGGGERVGPGFPELGRDGAQRSDPRSPALRAGGLEQPQALE